MSEKKNKKANLYGTVKTIAAVAAVAAVVILIFRFVIAVTIVDGNSMYPTLSNRDALVMTKLKGGIKRYDIVVFNSEINKQEYLIKRVIGLPGENVRIDAQGKIYIDSRPLDDDDYGTSIIQDGGRAATVEGVTLGKDEYFVMGDNRNRSEDSRFAAVGNIHIDQIEGRVLFRIYPLEKFGIVDLYRERAEAPGI